MITKWKLFNFKSISKETDLELAPLTILAGANSSGKSTVIQSMLLIAQTLSHKVGSRSIVLNGTLARLGQFDDLKSLNNDANQITIGWTCNPVVDTAWNRNRAFHQRRSRAYLRRRAANLISVSCGLSFDINPSGSIEEISQLHPRIFATQLSAIARDSHGADSHSSISIRRADILNDMDREELIRNSNVNEQLADAAIQYDVSLDKGSLSEAQEEYISAKPLGCLLKHFLPERILYSLDVNVENARLITKAFNESSRFARYRSISGDELNIPIAIVDVIINSAQSISKRLMNI